MNKTIVIAWVVVDFEVFRSRRGDLGERPELKAIRVPKAAVWLLSGTDEDVQKAQAYVDKNAEDGMVVFTYPVDEPNPLLRARVDVYKLPR